MASIAPESDAQTNPTCTPLLNWLVLTPDVTSAPSWSETPAGQGKLDQQIKEIQAETKELKRAKNEMKEMHEQTTLELADAFNIMKQNFEPRIQELVEELLRARKAERQMQKELNEAQSKSKDVETRMQQTMQELAQEKAKSRKVETQMSENFEKMRLRFLAKEHNTIARMKNSKLGSDLDVVSPLHNIHTNLPIRYFPSYVRDIVGNANYNPMGTIELGRVLNELGVSMGGTSQEKRERLKMTIGIV